MYADSDAETSLMKRLTAGPIHRHRRRLARRLKVLVLQRIARTSRAVYPPREAEQEIRRPVR
jgi:hypothetical protein